MPAFDSVQHGGDIRLRFIRVHVSDKPYWEFVTRTNASEGVTILAVTPSCEVVLVRQHRIPLDKMVIELPAGLVGDKQRGETPQQAVHKELLEETGYSVDLADIELLARGPALAGLTDEVNGLWLARNATPGVRGGGVASEGEKIETIVLPLATVRDRLRVLEQEGNAIDLKVFAGLHFLPDAQR